MTFTDLAKMFTILHGLPLVVRTISLVAVIPLVLYVYDRARQRMPLPGYPVVALDGKTPEDSWINFPKETLAKGAQLCPSSPFQVASHTGPKLVLPQKYADEVRTSRTIEFTRSVSMEIPWRLPGFEAFALQHHEPTILPTVVRTKLTSILATLIPSLVEEVLEVSSDHFPRAEQGGEWVNLPIHSTIQDMIARTTLRIMMGEEASHNPEMVDIHIQHAKYVFAAASEVRAFPTAVHQIVHWFLPNCQRLRRQLKRGQDLLREVVYLREREARATIAAGKKVSKHSDSVGWHVEVAQGRDYDPITGQLAFSMAAIHNTSAALAGAMWQLCERPEWLDILRKEAIPLLREFGWSRQALTKMELQDAFHKETLSYIRGPLTTVRRISQEDLTFHDGLRIPKDYPFYLLPLVQSDGREFDPYRWIKKREQSEGNQDYLFVTSNNDNQTFGLGKYACPGRFFAHDELKVALTILILQYDWRKAPNTPSPFFLAKEDIAHFPPGIELQVRPRQPEIDIP